MDHEDELIEGVSCFNLCTACGLAFPLKLWWIRAQGTGFYEKDLANMEAPYTAFMQRASNAKTKYHWRCFGGVETVRGSKASGSGREEPQGSSLSDVGPHGDELRRKLEELADRRMRCGFPTLETGTVDGGRDGDREGQVHKCAGREATNTY